MIVQKLQRRLWKMAHKIHKACIEDDAYKLYTHISFVLDGNDILSVGFNQIRTHPVCERFGYTSRFGISQHPSMHSEVHAATRLPYLEYLRGKTVVNMRLKENEKGETDIRMAKPCSTCMEFLSSCEVKKVIYSTDEGWDIWKPEMGTVNPVYGPATASSC